MQAQPLYANHEENVVGTVSFEAYSVVILESVTWKTLKTHAPVMQRWSQCTTDFSLLECLPQK